MLNRSTDNIRYSRQTGFTGITPKDREQWMRKYPHIEDFDLTVKEGESWLSENWNNARRAEERTGEFFDYWLGCKWQKLNTDGHKEPEKLYNPKQISSFIEQYFKSGELIKRLILGKHNGLNDSLAKEHYEKALGHAVKIREELPDFPRTPDATGKPHHDLRRLQEWCIECEKVANNLLGELKVDHLDKPLCLLRELDNHVKSGYPTINETVYARIKAEVWNELEKLVKVIEEMDEPKSILMINPTNQFEFKAEFWTDQAILGRDCEQLLKKLKEHMIHVPDDLNELADMISAAKCMAKTDWDRTKAICEKMNTTKDTNLSIEELGEQMSVLNVAKMTEEKINTIVWKIYRRENRDYDKLFEEAENRKVLLFNESAELLNSNDILLKISYLRDNRLVSAFDNLYNALFNMLARTFISGNPLQETINELESIRDKIAQHKVTTKPVETGQKAALSKGRKTIKWLKNHPHSYGLIGGFIFLVLFFVSGLLKTQWRSWCWGTAVIAFLVLIFSLRGYSLDSSKHKM